MGVSIESETEGWRVLFAASKYFPSSSSISSRMSIVSLSPEGETVAPFAIALVLIGAY